jgi:hypothetical protein
MGKFKEMDLLRQEQEKTAPVQEPLPDAVQWYGGVKSDDELTPTAQPAHWVGLTDKEVLKEAVVHLGKMHVENCGFGDIKDFALAIEAKLKEKNSG